MPTTTAPATATATACAMLLWLLSPSAVHAAWIVRSDTDNSWATGLARYDALRRPMVVMTQFHDGTNDLTVAGKMDTDCRVLIADATGVWNEIPYESPQLCVGGGIVDQDTNNGVGIVVGIDGDQTTLLNIDQVGTDTPIPGVTHQLPQNKIPVATHAGDLADDFVYVALHDIDDEPVYNGFGVDRPSNLLGIMAYWKKFTDPLSLSADQASHVPHIVKLNPETGVVAWRGIYNLSHGSATISSMLYADFSLIICGSTNGSGDAVGQNPNADWNDWDGYVAFINPVTGKVDETFVDPQTNEVEQRGFIRIASPNGGKNDFVHDMCLRTTASGGIDLFVVGTTDGRFSGSSDGGAFVVKIDVKARVITKRVQLTGADRTGLKIVCSDTHVFVGGHVSYNDAAIDQLQNVYVTAYDADLTEVPWSVEIDTTPYFYGELRSDQLVALELNPAGDVNVLLNSQVLTKGISHVVIMDLQSDSGANEIQKGATAGTEGRVPEEGIDVEPIEGQGESGDSDLGNQVGNGIAAMRDPKIAEKKKAEEEKKQRIVLALSITIPLTIALAVALYALVDRRKQRELMVKPPPAVPEEAPHDATPPPALDSSDRNMV
jgi:hypothetical protein